MNTSRHAAVFAGIIVLFIGIVHTFLGATLVSSGLGNATWVFLVTGLLCLVLGPVFLVHAWRSRKKQEDLRRHGLPVIGTVSAVRRSSVEINDEPLSEVVVRGDDGRTYVSEGFRSSRFGWEVGHRIGVLVDRLDPGRYLVDVQALGPVDDER